VILADSGDLLERRSSLLHVHRPPSHPRSDWCGPRAVVLARKVAARRRVMNTSSKT